jgi:iron(III) transport system substrate-binding protein
MRLMHLSHFVSRLALVTASIFAFTGCGRSGNDQAARKVVVYTSQDRPHATPILAAFEQQSGIKVEAVYDTEAAKTLGLMNRLVGERNNPQADVFWSSESTGNIYLKRKGVTEPYHSPSAETIPPRFKDKEGYWSGFGGRARVLMVNKDLVQQDPHSIRDFATPEWKGRFALANPLFGTTATHVGAWYVLLGKEGAESLLMSLRNNGVVTTTGNGPARDMVAAGEIAACVTDTDDAQGAIDEGRPVRMIYPDQGPNDGGVLIIPNTVSLIAGGPHRENGRLLIDFLLTEKVEEMLAFSPSAQMPLRPNVKHPPHVKSLSELKVQEVDFEKIADALDTARQFVQDSYLR